MHTFANRLLPSLRLPTTQLPDAALLGSRISPTRAMSTDLHDVMLYLTSHALCTTRIRCSLGSLWVAFLFIGSWNTRPIRVVRFWRSSSLMLLGYARIPSSRTGSLLPMVVFKLFLNGCFPLDPNLGRTFSRGTRRLSLRGTIFKVLPISGTRSLRTSWMASVCLAQTVFQLHLHLFQGFIAIAGTLAKQLNSFQFMPLVLMVGAGLRLGI